MAIILWNKNYTETLSLTLERFRQEYPEYSQSKVTYAGRLDPMAKGLMVLLTDDDVHQKESYLKMDKIYEVDFILGVETDTYDILGNITNVSDISSINEDIIIKQIEDLKHITTQTYPPYSSRPVNGKPLWKHAREGTLDTLELPVQSIELYDVSYLGKYTINTAELKDTIIKAINAVEGDFRQELISSSWGSYFKGNNSTHSIYRMRIHGSSGTYMRSLVAHIGTVLKVGGTSLKIDRIKIGDHIQ